MNSDEIREKFLSYFESKGHTRVSSSSLNQTDDPTILFPNAGMNQFKDCFLGTEKRTYTRATTSQKCMRISGKHNDFENVGVTPRHHTFFEMLGNFSFGDYFKREAIQFAWEFITEELEIPKERLWITIYQDDDEAHDLWVSETDVPSEKIVRLGEKDNFWAMGDTGPCGPCSEIHYVTHEDPSLAKREGLEEDDGSFLEIWNLVFMQFNRDENGTLNPLPKPSVDTGMGLERITAVVNNVHATYDTDLLKGVIQECEKLSDHTYDGSSYEIRNLRENLSYAKDVAMRVIADHSRAIAFLIADGIHPASDGRGYVLRRILRRAIRHGKALNFSKPFLSDTTTKVVEMLGKAYPELEAQRDTIASVAHAEEVRFYETLDSGLALLQKEVAALGNKSVFPGDIAFQLYDTYGFPLDLTEDALKAFNLSVDTTLYNTCLNEQRERSRSERKSKNINFPAIQIDGEKTNFIGYQELCAEASLQVIRGNKNQDSFSTGEEIQLVFNTTPFYAESGGQVGDTGTAQFKDGVVEIHDTQKTTAGHYIHTGIVAEGTLSTKGVGENVQLAVDLCRRKSIALNHSATHLIHAALRDTLGDHVKQAGSRVDDGTLRFDYSHFEPLTEVQKQSIQEYANREIRENYEVTIEEMPIEAAQKKGATALFGEKYGDIVRVVEIGPNSLELCGGTHVTRSGDIGLISLITEGGISSGVRRIECVSGFHAERKLHTLESELEAIGSLIKSDSKGLVDKIDKLINKQRILEKELEKAKAKLTQLSSGDFMTKVTTSPGGVSIIAEQVENSDAEGLKNLVDKLRQQLGTGVVALGTTQGDKAIVVTGVTPDLTSTVHAGKIIKEAVKESGGKGGGRADFAQAGGVPPAALQATLTKVRELVS